FGALDRSAEESFRQKRHYDAIVRRMLKQLPGVLLRTELAGDPAQGMEPDKCISLHFNPRHNHAAGFCAPVYELGHGPPSYFSVNEPTGGFAVLSVPVISPGRYWTEGQCRN